MNASTDVTYQGNKILFGYVIMDENNEYVVSKKCYYTESIEISIAEDVAVALLLRDIVESGYKNKIKINCDSLSSVERIKGVSKGNVYKRYKKLFNYIKEALSYGGSTVTYVPREKNIHAHATCKELRKEVLIEGNKKNIEQSDVRISDFNIYNLPNRVNCKCKKIRRYRGIGDINSDIGRMDKKHLLHEYRKLVQPNKMKNIDHLFVWGSIQKCSNTHDGRKKFVRQFVRNQHLKEELRKKVVS